MCLFLYNVICVINDYPNDDVTPIPQLGIVSKGKLIKELKIIKRKKKNHGKW